MNKVFKITEEDIQAFVDGQLDQQRHILVAKYIQQHPEVAERVAHYRQQNDLMHGLFDSTLDEPVPENIKPEKINQVSKPHSSIKAYKIAASVSLFILGGVMGWTTNSYYAGDQQHDLQRFVSQSASAHVVYTPEVKHPVEVEAKQEKHLVTWLSKRLKKQVKAPKLESLGYSLVGGRLLASDSMPAAFFMYENSVGERLTLYVKTSVEDIKETAFRFDQRNGLRTFYWIDGSVGYAITGQLSKPMLLDVAHSIYQQINL